MKKIIVVVAGLLASVAGIAAEKSDSRPNILFIAVDDLRNELGCYGIKEVKTPNIDRLAESGLVFTQHFAPVPTCGASRYALLTGRRPSESGATGKTNHDFIVGGRTTIRRKLLDGAQTFPELFKRSGYYTTCIGKISHFPDGKVYNYSGKGNGRPEMPNAWDELPTPYGKWKYGWGCFFAYDKGKHRSDGSGYKPAMEFPDVKDNELPDGMICDTAIKKLEEIKDKPFLMAVGFYKPHLPFVAPKKYRDMYNDVDVKLAPVQEKGETAYWHGNSELYSYKPGFKTRPLPKKDQIESKKAYYACVSYVDAQVGRLLDKLKELKLDKNTIVVLWGDHGWHLGDHDMWGKHTPLEHALKSPLIIRAPQMKSRGKSTDAIVETVDIYPTLVALCKPSFSKSAFKLGGVSLVPVLENPKHPGKDAAISYWKKVRSLRSGQYRLIATKGEDGYSKIELYDHEKDPDEANNIADEKKEVVEKLLKLIEKDSPEIREYLK